MLASSHATNYVFILCWHIHRNSLLLFHLHALSYDHALHQHFKTKMNMWIYEDFPNMCSYMQAPQIYSNPAHRLGARTSLCGSCNATSHSNTCSTFLQHMYPTFFQIVFPHMRGTSFSCVFFFPVCSILRAFQIKKVQVLSDQVSAKLKVVGGAL